MSTNKTQHYQLHSWAAEDKFLRSEFNENFTKLDTALKSEVQALTSAVGQKARVAVGSYTGDGAQDRTISLGFTPKAVLVFREDGFSCNSSYYVGGLAVTGAPCRLKLGTSGYYDIVGVVNGGFQVHYQFWSSSTCRDSNGSGTKYLYLAVA